jgi:hypothetical protein
MRRTVLLAALLPALAPAAAQGSVEVGHLAVASWERPGVSVQLFGDEVVGNQRRASSGGLRIIETRCDAGVLVARAWHADLPATFEPSGRSAALSGSAPLSGVERRSRGCDGPTPVTGAGTPLPSVGVTVAVTWTGEGAPAPLGGPSSSPGFCLSAGQTVGYDAPGLRATVAGGPRPLDLGAPTSARLSTSVVAGCA